MSTKPQADEAKTTKVVAVKPFHEVDGVVLVVGYTYDLNTETAEALIASGAVKKEA